MPGEERKEAFLRKGIVGDWENYFDRDVVRAYKTEKEGRWNRLLVKMGYENTLDWGQEICQQQDLNSPEGSRTSFLE